jgi:hypothetical protein
MKYIILILLLSLSACSEFFPGDGRFYIEEVHEGLTASKYRLRQTKGNGVVYIMAARGLYHVGDTLLVQAQAVNDVGYAEPHAPDTMVLKQHWPEPTPDTILLNTKP